MRLGCTAFRFYLNGTRIHEGDVEWEYDRMEDVVMVNLQAVDLRLLSAEERAVSLDSVMRLWARGEQ